MRTPRERRDDQPAFVLHTYAYRETSVIVEALTASYGRVALVARGVRRPRSELRGVLQAFQPLIAVMDGGRGAQDPAQGRLVRRPAPGRRARRCLCGFYLNELLLKLLPREDPHPQLYRAYEATLARLAGGAEQAPVLRSSSSSS